MLLRKLKRCLGRKFEFYQFSTEGEKHLGFARTFLKACEKVDKAHKRNAQNGIYEMVVIRPML